MGPNTDPCCTPDVTDSSSEQLPSSTTDWDLPIKKDEILFRVVPCTPCILSLYNSLR